MAKHYFFAFIISGLVCASMVLIGLMINLPQSETLVAETVETYTKIDTSQFQFVETKHFVTQILAKEYNISSDDISSYRNTSQYKPGNYDPFTPEEQQNNATQGSTQDNANNNTTNNNNGTANSSGSTK